MKTEIITFAVLFVVMTIAVFVTAPIMTDEDIIVFSLSLPTAFGLSWLIVRWLKEHKLFGYADIQPHWAERCYIPPLDEFGARRDYSPHVSSLPPLPPTQEDWDEILYGENPCTTKPPVGFMHPKEAS